MLVRIALLLLWAFTAYAASVEVVAGGGESAAGAAPRAIKLVEPFGVAFDSDGSWYVCEHKGERIVRVSQSETALVAGTGEAGFSGDGGPASQAAFFDPHAVVMGPGRQLYVADTRNHRVRRIDLRTGVVTTIAGNGSAGYAGDGGPATAASFNGTFAIALSQDGGLLYVADLGNRRIREVQLKAGSIRTIAGNGESGVPPDGAAAASAPLVDPRAVAADRQGNVYILERNGNALRVVNQEGKIRTLISPGSLSPDLNGPKHLTVDRNGDVIIADAENHLVRKFIPATGKTVTIAGTGTKGYRVDASDPLKTELNRPHGVSVDSAGRLYISDSYNHRVLRVTP
jgi:DNA-binding beta-propeller fold protein YncE